MPGTSLVSVSGDIGKQEGTTISNQEVYQSRSDCQNQHTSSNAKRHKRPSHERDQHLSSQILPKSRSRSSVSPERAPFKRRRRWEEKPSSPVVSQVCLISSI